MPSSIVRAIWRFGPAGTVETGCAGIGARVNVCGGAFTVVLGDDALGDGALGDEGDRGDVDEDDVDEGAPDALVGCVHADNAPMTDDEAAIMSALRRLRVGWFGNMRNGLSWFVG